MTHFDKLYEVRDVARARALEDFEYFANSVMGVNVARATCDVVQELVLKGRVSSLTQFDLPQHKLRSLQNAAMGWMILLHGHADMHERFAPNATYEWLFADERAA